MKKKYIYCFAFLLCINMFSSCESLDVMPPNDITDEQIKEILNGSDNAKIELVLKAIGASLQNDFNIYGKTYTAYSSYPQNSQYNQDFMRNLMGNDVVCGSVSTSKAFSETYSIASPFYLAEYDWPFWALPVDCITDANKALNYLTEEIAQKNTMVKSYRGHALSLRAYGYMLLMERFQNAYTNGGENGKGMPIYTAYKINDNAKISSAKETYEFILKDLKDAVACLTETDGYTAAVNDIDLGVAQYLLARAALWFGDWQTCIIACQDIAKHYTNFIKESNYGGKAADEAAIVAGTKEIMAKDNAFFSLNVNPEVIMGFSTGETANTTLLYGFTNIFAGKMVDSNGNECATAGYGQEWPCIDSRLYVRMDNRDFRKDNFTTEEMTYTYVIDKEGNTENRTIGKYANLKFAATICLNSSVRDVNGYCDNVVIRSSEVYLMLAEAYARIGNEMQAKETLNKLLAARTKEGVSKLTCDNYSGMQGMNILQMVQFQTRLEMWCEKGLEFYNNKRWNIPVDRNGSENHYHNVVLSVENMRLQIPTMETNSNTHWSD